MLTAVVPVGSELTSASPRAPDSGTAHTGIPGKQGDVPAPGEPQSRGSLP